MDAEQKIKEYLKEGAVIADVYFDAHAKNEEELKNLCVGLTKTIAGKEGVLYSSFEIEEPQKNGDVFSTYVKGRLLTQNFVYLVRLVLDYSPVSVEIVKPEEIKLDLAQANDLLMELSKTTYDYKMYIYKKVASPEDKKRILQSYENRKKLGEKLRGEKK